MVKSPFLNVKSPFSAAHPPRSRRSFVPPEDLEILLRRLRRATPLLLRGFAAAKDWELRRLWEDAEGGKQAEGLRLAEWLG